MATAAQKKSAQLLTEKSYRLADDRSGESFLLKVGRDMRLLVFDIASKSNRAIRHCPNEKSIYLDEQSSHALVEPIIFEFGTLDVPPTEQHTQRFLDAHPDNTANGGSWFGIVDDEADATVEVEREDKIHDIRTAVREKEKEDGGIHYLEMIAAVLINSVQEASKMTKHELKRVIYNAADEDPDYFLDENGNVNIFDDADLQRKHMILRALGEGILVKSPNNKSILWGKGGKVISTSPAGIDIIEYFADFLSTDEGLLVVAELEKRV